jgi:hypothetical protein
MTWAVEDRVKSPHSFLGGGWWPLLAEGKGGGKGVDLFNPQFYHRA